MMLPGAVKMLLSNEIDQFFILIRNTPPDKYYNLTNPLL